jgi:hypothetical protein
MWDSLYHKDYYTDIMDYAINLRHFNIDNDLKRLLICIELDCLYKSFIANNSTVIVVLFFY